MQARAVIDGLPAEMVALALPLDIDRIAHAGLIDSKWRGRYPCNSTVSTEGSGGGRLAGPVYKGGHVFHQGMYWGGCGAWLKGGCHGVACTTWAACHCYTTAVT